MAETLIPTPNQTVGPYYKIGMEKPWNDLTQGGKAQGQAFTMHGYVLDGDGKPVPDSVVEIWQANAAGRYAHPEDGREDAKLDPNFVGFGRACCDDAGHFTLTSVKPGPVPGLGNSWQAPHLLLAVFARGMLKHLYTRAYFPEDTEAQAADPVLALIEDPAARATLIAKPEAKGDQPRYRFDIILQGEGETVFFEV